MDPPQPLRGMERMTEDAKIIAIIYDAIDEINELLPAEQQAQKSLDAVLVGQAGCLDSFGLVNLIVAVEQRVNDEFGIALTLADERAMSRSRSPFRTVATLRDYIAGLLKEVADA